MRHFCSFFYCWRLLSFFILGIWLGRCGCNCVIGYRIWSHRLVALQCLHIVYNLPTVFVLYLRSIATHDTLAIHNGMVNLAIGIVFQCVTVIRLGRNGWIFGHGAICFAAVAMAHSTETLVQHFSLLQDCV